MKAYQIVQCSVECGKLEKVWQQYFYFDKNKAEAKLLSLVKEADEFDGNRKGRCYEPYTIEGIRGWVVWQYGVMFYLKEIEIEGEENDRHI